MPVKRISGILLWTLLLASPFGQTEEVKTKTPEALLEQLQNGNFDERQEAEKALLQMGEAVRPLVEKTVKSTDDLDTRAAMSRILDGLYRSTVQVVFYDRKGIPFAKQKATYFSYGNPRNPQEKKEFDTNEKGEINILDLKPGFNQLSFQMPEVDIYNQYSQFMLRKGPNRMVCVGIHKGSVSGTVLTDQGKPIENVELKLLSDNGYIPPNTDWAALKDWGNQATITAKPTGEFVAEKLSPGAYLVFINHDDFQLSQPMTVRVYEDEDTKLTEPIKLESKASVTGGLKVQVVDNEGKPLAKTKIATALLRLGDQTGTQLQEMMNRGIGWNRRGGNINAVDSETDENGFLEFKYNKPGAYRLALEPETGTPLLISPIEIKKGEVIELKGQKFPKSGSLAGDIKTEDGKGVEYMQIYAVRTDDPLAIAMASNPDNMHTFLYLLQSRNNNNAKRNAAMMNNRTNKDGHFEVKDLAPGSYYIICQGFDGRTRLWFETPEHNTVVEEKTVNFGTMKVLKDKEGNKFSFEVKGQVLLPDGTPASNANIQMSLNQGSWGSRAGQDGKFNMSQQNYVGGKPDRLMVSMPGHKTHVIDLNAAGVDQKNLTIKLEKQVHGSLKVKIVDQEGKPLSNVAVNPIPGSNRFQVYNNWNNQQGTPIRYSNTDGQVVIRGLAPGKRNITISLEGYILDQPQSVDIQAGKENLVNVVMKPGLEVSGTLQLPEGSDFSKAAIYALVTGDAARIGQQAYRCGEVDEKGRFKIGGLSPGAQTLGLVYPGLTPDASNPVTVEAPKTDLVLKMSKPGAFKFDLGPACKSQQLVWYKSGEQVVEKQVWRESSTSGTREKRPGVVQSAGGSSTDYNGKSEHYGSTPGTYDLWVLQSGMVQQMYNGAIPQASTYLKLKTFEMKPAEGGQVGFKAQPYEKINVKPGTGIVRMKMTLKNADQMPSNGNFGQMTFYLSGTDAYSTLMYYPQNRIANRSQVMVVGTPPPEIKQTTNRDEFVFRNLPPGEYKLYATFSNWNYNGQEALNYPVTEKGVPIKTVPLAEGQDVQLEEIQLEVPKAYADKMRDAMRANSMNFNNSPDSGVDDEPELVQP